MRLHLVLIIGPVLLTLALCRPADRAADGAGGGRPSPGVARTEACVVAGLWRVGRFVARTAPAVADAWRHSNGRPPIFLVPLPKTEEYE